MWKDLEGDRLHVVILFFLYCLQGIPLGLDNAIPLILSRRDVPYTEQATFSISTYPFSMKVLWAPIVNSVFWARFGRRKSWLVPAQYLIGIVMIISSQYVNTLLGDDNKLSLPSDLTDTNTNSTLLDQGEIEKTVIVPDVPSLTAMFTVLYFLAATQDIAVDGWAITMLRPENVGYASTCNAVGQSTGWVLGYVVFTTLEAKGIMDLSQFLLLWGVVFVVITTTIAIFKKEKSIAEIQESSSGEEAADQELDLGLVKAYKILWKIIVSPRMYVWILYLLTATFGFSAAESIFNLKLIEFGVPRESIAQLSLPMIPVKILVTLLIARYTAGPRPMNVWLTSFPLRIVFCGLMVVFVYFTPLIRMDDGEFPSYYYVLLTCLVVVHRISLYCMFVAGMAFHNKISDPLVGGTYMTLLNTFSNLGNKWSSSFSLWFVDQITFKQCEQKSETISSPLELSSNTTISSSWAQSNNTCYGTVLVEQCKEGGGECVTLQEGFYTMATVWLVIGSLWFVWVFRTIRHVQTIDPKQWRVINKAEMKEEEANKDNFKYFYFF